MSEAPSISQAKPGGPAACRAASTAHVHPSWASCGSRATLQQVCQRAARLLGRGRAPPVAAARRAPGASSQGLSEDCVCTPRLRCRYPTWMEWNFCADVTVLAVGVPCTGLCCSSDAALGGTTASAPPVLHMARPSCPNQWSKQLRAAAKLPLMPTIVCLCPPITKRCRPRAAQTAPDSVDKSKYLGPSAGTTALLHAAPHWTTGGVGPINNSERGDVGQGGRRVGKGASCMRRQVVETRQLPLCWTEREVVLGMAVPDQVVASHEAEAAPRWPPSHRPCPTPHPPRSHRRHV